MNDKKYEKIKKAVEKELSCSAHHLDHVMRVYNLCLRLARNEEVDLEVLKISALLHDIARAKEDNDQSGEIDHAKLSAVMARAILQKLDFPEEKIKHIQDCIISHRYRTGDGPTTKEARILFDADKLDTLGAIGIARQFAWVGKNKANIYKKADIVNYAKDNLGGGKINGRIKDKTKHSPQIEFVTKIKFIVKKLHTKEAKKMAEERI